MAKINFGGMVEDVVTRDEFPLEKARQVLKDEVVAVLGYGVQGPAQSLNMRDNGINVIVGQGQGDKDCWEKAVKDGWVPGKTLFSLEEAAERGTIIQYLVSDAAQMMTWPKIKPCLKKGDALYFSHGFSIVVQRSDRRRPARFRGRDPGRAQRVGDAACGPISWPAAASTPASPCTRMLPAAPWSGRLAVGIAIGSGYLFPTTFKNEVYSDLTGERGVLMGALAGIMEAQYNLLRKHGHTPERSVQRDGRGIDPEPDPPGRPERHGLDVRQLQHHRAARRARLAAPVPQGGRAGLRLAVRKRRLRRADAHRPRSQQRAGLQGEAGRRTARDARIGNVAGRRGRALPAAGQLEQSNRTSHEVDGTNWSRVVRTIRLSLA